MDSISLDDFLAGKPLSYESLSGRPLRATWKHESGIGYLNIEDARGRIMAAPVTPEHEAINFYNRSQIKLG